VSEYSSCPLPVLAIQPIIDQLTYTPTMQELAALHADSMMPADERTSQMKRRDAEPKESVWQRIRFVFLCIKRTVVLFALALPVAVTAPLCFYVLPPRFREMWYGLLVRTIERAGCAAIKLAQWLSHREDFLDPDLCRHLRKLRSDAPAHNAAYTRAAIRAAFGLDIDDLFSDFSHDPVASGSVAQVHKAVLRPDALQRLAAASDADEPPSYTMLELFELDREAALAQRQRQRDARAWIGRVVNAFSNPISDMPTSRAIDTGMRVAVKIRHPGVSDVLRADVWLFFFWTRLVSKIPGLGWMRIPVAMHEFAHSLRAQVRLGSYLTVIVSRAHR
jgi:aarF domain-containing kinase